MTTKIDDAITYDCCDLFAYTAIRKEVGVTASVLETIMFNAVQVCEALGNMQKTDRGDPSTRTEELFEHLDRYLSAPWAEAMKEALIGHAQVNYRDVIDIDKRTFIAFLAETCSGVSATV